MGFTEGTGHRDNKPRGWLMVLGLGILVLVIIFASGCAAVESGKIVDKFYEAGRTEIECKGTGLKKKCKPDTNPPVCRFYLDDGTEKGWLDVDCNTTFNFYEVGQQYP